MLMHVHVCGSVLNLNHARGPNDFATMLRLRQKLRIANVYGARAHGNVKRNSSGRLLNWMLKLH